MIVRNCDTQYSLECRAW